MSFRKLEEVHDEEEDAFISSPDQSGPALAPPLRPRRTACWYIRILVEASMAVAIVLLLVRPVPESCRQLRRTPVPEFPRRKVIFKPNQTLLNDNMFENETTTLQTLHKWIPLSAKSRGYIPVADSQAYDLQKPYEIAVTQHSQGPGYMMTVFHQLHCLSYLIEHFQQGYDNITLTEEVAHHSVHCFDYIRQGLMCQADTSLEGDTEYGPGWGSEHVCLDYDALLDWANENGGASFRNSLMPELSIL